MKTVVGGLCLLAACVLMPVGWLSFAGPEVRHREELRGDPDLLVGEIDLRGNTVTRDRVIREALKVYPNQVLVPAHVKRSEAILVRRFAWRCGWWLGQRPRIEIHPPEDNPRYCRFTIHFPEGPLPRWLIAAIDEGPLDAVKELLADRP
jgi:hypothetical protein